nr:MAG TPA: hypothetical protein [Caudoviricetes sp.]
MKKIVRGNDFTLRVPVMKIVDGERVAFPLPGCTDIKVNIVNQYRRIALSYTIDVSEDNVLLARVEGDKVAVGTYALEVKGKIFGNDWRSNEYEQFQIVDNNASGDTVFEPQEGEDSVEMDTALVVLAPAVELGNLIKDAEETIADTKEALKGVETKMGNIEKRADTAIGAATTAAEKANTAAKKTEKTNAAVETAEKERVAAESERKTAEEQRKSQMQSNVKAEQARADAEQHRVEAEKRRASAETMRAAAEETRKTDEADRITGETSREKQEASRVAAENTRERMEADRANAETERAAAETARADAETKRADAETKRETDFSTKIAEVDTAVKNAKTATSEAENVDATITAANVLEVTGRDGVKKSLELVEQAEASEMKADVARIKESIGAYSDRPNITLTAKENNVAISADGVKVSKNGWAIAEFTAEKGNEYLFKPNVVDGTVCIFAEKISSVETRSIDYTYSYNEDGTTASATATYLGKTHTYSYAYTDGEDGTKSVTITDESGAVVTELPYQYKTTVGSYAPLVRLNAGAELPEDGYCRFMSHFQGNASMTVAVSYKVGTADLTMKVLRDGVFASISTQLGNLSQKENETRSLAVELKEKMATFVDTNPYVGMVRMNGDASPDAEMTFGDKQLMHEVGAEWKLATVKNGVVTHVCAPGRLTLDENGEEVKIDGTDGDVMLINRNANVINATKVVDGREMNCLAIGKTTAKWYGVESKKMPAFGMTPCETVNAKIDGDARSQAHCIYNTTVNGMYDTADTSVLKASYINRGTGHASNISALSSIQNAQNKNTDPLTARPYMGWHHGTYEALLTTMFAEIGSVNHTGLDMFGSGLCWTSFDKDMYNDDAISAVSGWKIIAATGETYYRPYSGSQVYVTSKNEKISLARGLSLAIFNPVQLLEGQRLLDAIAKAGLVDKIGNKANIFYYDESGNAVCASGGSVNIDTGEGMEVLKFYFVVRDVPRCEGMKDGVMTAVVNRYVKTELADGCQSVDKKVSLDGAIAILKASIPIYRGFTLPYVGQYRHLSYAYYTIHNIDGVLHVDFRCTDGMEDVQPLTVFNQSAYLCAYGTTPPMLVGLNKKKGYGVANIREGFFKASDYSMSQFCYKTVGASLHTHECAYWYLSMGGNGEVNTSHVYGSIVGCAVNQVHISARTAIGIYDTNFSANWYSGAFAVLLNQ